MKPDEPCFGGYKGGTNMCRNLCSDRTPCYKQSAPNAPLPPSKEQGHDSEPYCPECDGELDTDGKDLVCCSCDFRINGEVEKCPKCGMGMIITHIETASGNQHKTYCPRCQSDRVIIEGVGDLLMIRGRKDYENED